MEHFTYVCLSRSLLVLVFQKRTTTVRLLSTQHAHTHTPTHTHTHTAIKTLELRKLTEYQCYYTYMDLSIINTFLPLTVRETDLSFRVNKGIMTASQTVKCKALNEVIK